MIFTVILVESIIIWKYSLHSLGKGLYFPTPLRSSLVMWCHICYFWAEILRASAWLDLLSFLSNVSDKYHSIIVGYSIRTMRGNARADLKKNMEHEQKIILWVLSYWDFGVICNCSIFADVFLNLFFFFRALSPTIAMCF